VPFIIPILGFTLTFILFCSLYTLSSIEYVLINSFSREYRADFTSILLERP
jgi:hypothetical protein